MYNFFFFFARVRPSWNLSVRPVPYKSGKKNYIELFGAETQLFDVTKKNSVTKFSSVPPFFVCVWLQHIGGIFLENVWTRENIGVTRSTQLFVRATRFNEISL